MKDFRLMTSLKLLQSNEVVEILKLFYTIFKEPAAFYE